MSPSRHQIKKSLLTTFNGGIRWKKERFILRSQQALHAAILLTNAELDRPIFVIGAPRSGTTLLYTVLRRSSNLAHWRPTEAHEVWEADYHPVLRGWDSNVLDASDVNPEAAARIKRSFLLVTGRNKRLIDKTPRNVLRIPFIDAIFPNARYIYLKRDGRDNVNSLINAWRSPRYRTYKLPERHAIPGTDPKWWKFVLYPGWQEDRNGPLEMVAAKQWLTSNEHVLNAQRTIDPARWTDVRYEDLVESPVEEVGRLLAFADVPYEDEIRQRAAAMSTTPINTVTPPERGKWRRENPDEIAAIVDLIAPMMEKMGYRLDEANETA
ncbi:MAG: sulfotransferase family protein [Actinomycetota bacterium]